MNRAATLTLLLLAAASCATTYAPALAPAQVAQVKIVGPRDTRFASDGYHPRTFDMLVHDYSNGCPLVESTRTSKGYKGNIEVAHGATTTVAVPTGRRLTFTSEWRVVYLPPQLLPLGFPMFCTSVVSFVPRPGRTYVIRSPEIPDGGKRACGATAEIEGTPQNTGEPSEPIAYPHVVRGAEAFQPGGLCALGAD